MTSIPRFYRTHRPSLVSAPVAPMDEQDSRFSHSFLQHNKPLPMREWLERSAR